jgi:SAM-dependent methyltransferase
MEDSKEPTFRSYNQKQGAAYSQNRPTYHPNLYKTIIDYHVSTGGELFTILDVGCGPGNAVRDLSSHFTQAIGIDPSDGMIQAARNLGGTSSDGSPIRFEISTAEELGSGLSMPLPVSSVDLIVAATAAHWFDMSLFWPRAAKLLKPGGSVALWAARGGYIHSSTPNHVAIQDYITHIQDLFLRPHAKKGTEIAFNLYADLLLPWCLESTEGEFDKKAFLHKVWNKDFKCLGGDEFFASQQVPQFMSFDLDKLEKMLATKGTVTRWREANADKIGTEKDIMKLMRGHIEGILYEAGVQKGKEELNMGVEGVLMIMKKHM